jgi:Glycosyltransferase
MNIAIFTDCYYPIKNGVVTSVLQLKEGLERKGHGVFVVTTQVRGYEEKDINVLRVPSFPIGLGTELVFGLVNQKRINKLVKDYNIQIIHTHTEFSLGISGKLAARKFHLPHVHTTHTMWEEYRHYILKGMALRPKTIRKILKLFLKNSYAIVCPSLKAKKYYESLGLNMPIQIIHNGIDRSRFRGKLFTHYDITKKRKEWNIKASDTVIIFVGRIAQEKRVLELFDAVLPILKNDLNVKMIFVGNGPCLPQLKIRSKNLNNIRNQCIFTGYVTWDTVYELYSISDLFVTASLSEAHPMTLIEAVTCSLPVIARKDESYTDLVQNEVNGFLVDTDSQLTKKIYEIISNKNILQKFANESLRISQLFAVENHVNKMEILYKKILASYPSPVM